jgi:hypothetical protein
MSAQSRTKAQAKNNKAFESRLDRLTGYLVNGDWHGSFRSWTEADNASIVNAKSDKEELEVFTMQFLRIDGGEIKTVETIVEDGEIAQETFIVGIQPFEKTFYMVSIEDNDLAFGSICRKSNTISISKLEDTEPGDERGLGNFQFTDLLA